LFMKSFKVPTGYLFVDEYSQGKLETLSIGDYGKRANIKADFLGYTKHINGVDATECVPLTEKWVMTLSTQYGCSQKCRFCACPNVKFKGNASYDDLMKQFVSARNCFPNVRYAERLNIHFARMGEPMFNYKNVFDFSCYLNGAKHRIQDKMDLRIETLHPVFTTSIPKALSKNSVIDRLKEWCEIKNDVYNGQAGLQLSINSTDDTQRDYLFNNCSHSLKDIAIMCEKLPVPIGRKYCLNFAVADDTIINASDLLSMFDPNNWMVKLTPIHNCNACVENNIKTTGGYDSYYPYAMKEQSLVNACFDTLVFVPSMDEENGLVTCGNAVLGGCELKTKTGEI